MSLHGILKLFVRILARSAPPDRRSRWREEWLGELENGFATLPPRERRRRFATMIVGMMADCLAIRRVGRSRNRKQAGTAARGIGIESIFRDFRFATRMIRKNPGFSLVAVTALALGIGLATFSFSVVHGAYMRGLPYENAGDLFHIEFRRASGGGGRLSPTRGDFDTWREVQRSFEDIGAYGWGEVTLSGGEVQPERYFAATVTPSVFPLLRVNPLLGRSFVEQDAGAGAPAVVVIAYSVWRDRFGSDPGIVGRAVTANGTPATVIGVMPEHFEFPEYQKIWMPVRVGHPDSSWVGVPFGRLRAGMDRQQAHTEVSRFAELLQSPYRDSDAGFTTRMVPFEDAFADGDAPLISAMLLGGSLLLLIVVAANVANLLFGRMWVRTGEIAVRTAIGASRARVISQVLLEAFVLALTGAPIGILLARIGLEWITVASSHENTAFWTTFEIDAPTLAFTLAVTLLASLFASLLPAVRASRTDVNRYLKEGGFGSSSLQIGRTARALVVVQIATSFGLLAVSGLAIKGVARLADIDLGFPEEQVLTALVQLPTTDYPSDESRTEFWDHLVSRLEATPGVFAASVASRLPGNSACCRRVEVEGDRYDTDEDRPLVSGITAGPGFFDIFNLPALLGRLPGNTDVTGAPPVAVVNESFAGRLFRDGTAIGKRIRWDPEQPWATVVGVVPDQYMEGLESPQRGYPAGVYLPRAQNPLGYQYVILRVRGDALRFATELREAVAALDPNLPVSNVRSMDQVVRQETSWYRVFALLSGVTGTGALALTIVGLYGIVSLAVAHRTRDVGVRVALGASDSRLLASLIRKSLIEVAFGLVLGTGLALALARGLAFMFYDVQPWDPTVLAGLVVAFGLTAVTATVIPALRALRIDPMVALRNQ